MASSLFTPFNSQAEVARFTASGALDNGGGGFGKQKSGYTLSTFGMPKNVFHDVAVQPDDKLVAVGLAYTDGPYRRLITARYTASGTLDTTFNGSGYSVFLPQGISDSFGSAVALQTNGKIVVSGFSTGTDGAPDMLVVRYNSNGTLDTSFGGSGYVRLDDSAATQSQEYGNDVVIQSDGKIVVGGWTSVAGNPSNILVARFNVDGTRDSTFAAGGYKIGAPVPSSDYHSFEGQGVALQTDGSIIVAGSDRSGMTSSSAVFHPLLMRFSGTNSALAPTVSRSTNSAAAATDTAIALLVKEDLTSSNLKKNSTSEVQTATPANTSPAVFGGTSTSAALTINSSPVQKSNSSKSGLGKISSPDPVLSLDDWFGSLGQ